MASEKNVYAPPKSSLGSPPSRGLPNYFYGILLLLIFGNALLALVYGGGLLLSMNEHEHSYLSGSEVLKPILYLVDVYCLYLLLKRRIVGLTIIVLTSVIYSAAAWYSGAIIYNIFARYESFEFGMFVITATALPFLHVVLLYLLFFKINGPEDQWGQKIDQRGRSR